MEPVNLCVLSASNSFLAYILQPTRITSHSKTLTDNIFTNVIFPVSWSGNLTITISDHLLQFLTVSNILSNPPFSKSNIYERDWSNFYRENFILDYFSIYWNEIFFCPLALESKNVLTQNIVFLLQWQFPLLLLDTWKLEHKLVSKIFVELNIVVNVVKSALLMITKICLDIIYRQDKVSWYGSWRRYGCYTSPLLQLNEIAEKVYKI